MEEVLSSRIETFSKKYLVGKDEKLLGFVVLDDEGDALVATSFEPSLVTQAKIPLKNWVVWSMSGIICAKRLWTDADFRLFVEARSQDPKISES